MDDARFCDELEREGGLVVDLARNADPETPVVTCPDWRVADLLAHLGVVHRWAEHLVRVRASRRLSAREMDLARGPVEASWLAEGLTTLVATLRQSDFADEMWAWGADQHVRFWARRMLHETLVHRVDLDGALGVASPIDPVVAVDAIDEFLVNLPHAARFSPDVARLVGTGEILEFRCDEGPRWSLRLTPSGFESVPGDVGATATLAGPSSELLVVLTRRRDVASSACRVDGRSDVMTHWLANSALR